MQTAFKLGYGLVVAILLVLAVILGIRTFYAEPEGPPFPDEPSLEPFPAEPEGPPFPDEPSLEPFPAEPARAAPILPECKPDGTCFDPETGREITREEADRLELERLAEEERQFIEQEREFQESFREFEEERQAFILEKRAPYHRNVFILASALGVAAMAAGAALFRRVEAIPLGLVLGGLGVVIFGWAQAAEDFGEIGMAPLFAVVAVGLAVVLAAGYWFLSARQPAGGSVG